MFLEYTKKKLINKSIVEYLQVKNQDIISISGAGGKTSTIKLLAKNLVREHKKVLITTTTKMFKTADAITIRDKNLLKQKLKQQNWVFTGQDYGKKISSWDEEFLREIISLHSFSAHLFQHKPPTKESRHTTTLKCASS